MTNTRDTSPKAKAPRSRAQSAFSGTAILLLVLLGFVGTLTIVGLCGAALVWAWRGAMGL